MLYKGKRSGYYLYELTVSDLAWEAPGHAHYQVGNVLLFTDKKQIALGAEAAKADDLSSVYDYLDGNVRVKTDVAPEEPPLIATLRGQLAQSEANLQRRDDLLHDLSADLESQRNSNQVLIAQLEAMREQIHIEKLSKDEVLGDLEVVSAETYRKDQELQETLDAKTQLEQELAARICDLLELDSANSELQKRLEEQAHFDTVSTETAVPPMTNPTHQEQPDTRLSTQILTTADGKQVHVYHEFPAHQKRGAARGASAVASVLRVAIVVVAAVVIFVAGSVVATAELNDMSWGEALDLTLKALMPS